ncbi:hypothetical protein HDU79_000536 [Rhizoclosmatium sp. JEL0117]|nr:hypothetical protein HDU79_000536 [Rhizoclosmatium sp. JEL0117]
MTVIVAAKQALDANNPPPASKQSVAAQLIFTPPLPRHLNPVGSGVVSIRESSLVFEDSTREFVIDYPSIVIYAISRAPPCIYCQLDEWKIESVLPQTDAEGTADDETEEDPTFEMRIVPDDIEKLDDLFEAITYCASLHPDKNAMDEEDDEDDGWMMTADDFQEDFDGARQAALDHLEKAFVGGVRKETEDRFEDAEETDPKRVKEQEER